MRARDIGKKQIPPSHITTTTTQFVYKVEVKLTKAQKKLRMFRKDKQDETRLHFHKGSYRLLLAPNPLKLSVKHTNVKVLDLQ